MTQQEMTRATWAPRVRGTQEPWGTGHSWGAVVADQALTGQAVADALSVLGFACAAHPVPRRRAGTGDLRAKLNRHGTKVGILLHERVDWEHTQRVLWTVSDIKSVSWIVLADSDDAARWGAILDAGASAVLSMSMGVDDLFQVLNRVSAGEDIVPADDRVRMMSAWAEQRVVVDRIYRLTAREREVLESLRRGCTVAQIAAQAFVTVGTVRSQVSAILAKLEVPSQLAAVALLNRTSSEPYPLGA